MTSRLPPAPAYRHYKPKDLAVVRLDGQDHYLGKYDSPASRRKYYELLAARCSAGDTSPSSAPHEAPPAPVADVAPLSIKELCLAYFEFAQVYYRKGDRPTAEVDCIRHTLRRLLRLYGDLPVTQLGPKALKQVRDEFIRDDLARVTVNNNVARIKRMVRWGVENELVPVAVHQALMTVVGLRKGRSTARESKPVFPVEDAVVEATLPFLATQVQSMVRLQRLTGCRPGEVCMLRPCDVDRSAEVWCYRPAAHKMEHRDLERRIYLGPRAQEILAPWLNRPSADYCFSPAEAELQRRAALHAARKTPLHRGNRPGSNRQARPRRPPGKRYSPDSYRRAIARACQLAKVAVWCPNQLRHTRATELRRLHGLEAAQVVLGHSDAFVTEIYAEQDFDKAKELMRLLG